MGDKTKIDWCDASWNPVTGCLHDCLYCYARRMANRYGGFDDYGCESDYEAVEKRGEYVLDAPALVRRKGGNLVKAPYPFDFAPTFHRYRLNIPARWQRPRTIFVCSMADLFGQWVPDEWIKQVFDACIAAPQHRYLFLTKNPSRYLTLWKQKGIIMPNTIEWWYGYSIDGWTELQKERPVGMRTFCSVEPILRQPDAVMLDQIGLTNWCIIGAETGNRTGKVVPEKSWIEAIVSRCRAEMIPVFMKASLHSLMGDDFVQEYPWEV